MARAIFTKTGISISAGARTVDATGNAVDCEGHRGVEVYWKLTALTGTSVALNVQVQDPTTNDWITLLTTAAKTAPMTTAERLLLFPGVTVAANLAVSTPIGTRARCTTTSVGLTNMNLTATVVFVP